MGYSMTIERKSGDGEVIEEGFLTGSTPWRFTAEGHTWRERQADLDIVVGRTTPQEEMVREADRLLAAAESGRIDPAEFPWLFEDDEFDRMTGPETDSGPK